MLLFSTILNTEASMRPDDFIRLVLAWNAESSYEENRVKGVDWHGEYTIRFGDPKLWLEFIESPDGSIIAARHEKITEDGVVWDSDFVANFDESRISIRLDRTYSEDALAIDAAFSTPHFISLLIRQGYLQDDKALPVLRTAIPFSDGQANLIRELVSGEGGYQLPVVLVFKASDESEPLEVKWLASRLKGAAHVLVEEAERGEFTPLSEREMLQELLTFVENLNCDCHFITHHTISGKNLTGADFLKRKDKIVEALRHEIEHGDMDLLAAIRRNKRSL